MARSKPLTIEALAQLGPERLAVLLIDAAERDAPLARTLRIAVASRGGAASAAAEIDAEIKRFKRSKSHIDWKRVPEFARDLSALSTAIEGPLADVDPGTALQRMFDFIDLAPTLIERCDDSDGHIGDIIRCACTTAAALAARAAPALPPERAAQRAYQTYLCDEYGVADDIIAAFSQALDPATRGEMRSWIEADLERLPPPADPQSTTARFGQRKLIRALAAVADADGDVDAYCAAQRLLEPRTRDDAGMAQRLFNASRAAEALAVIEAAEPNPAKNEIALADLRIAALSELGRHDEAQALRWREFTRGLREQPLRDLLKRLPDFVDMEKEAEALAFAATYPEPHRAIEFLTAWPDLRRAAAVAEGRLADVDGNAYWVLGSAAERLEAREPLAATLLFRKMIDFTLGPARSSRYGHAVRHLRSCAWLAQRIADWHGHLPHTEYVAALHRQHARKVGFWSRLASDDSS
jgi:hypothetical protein